MYSKTDNCLHEIAESRAAFAISAGCNRRQRRRGLSSANRGANKISHGQKRSPFWPHRSAVDAVLVVVGRQTANSGYSSAMDDDAIA